ncbi:MAG TPA: hypothetical protein VHJ18_11875 [Streptosporangiaceae bacterium]|jgi:hypothetical protein|nr:hypothetical protein [Streptosporangiaceae bacterium]
MGVAPMAGEFALASCALAVPGEDDGACPLVGVASMLEGGRGGEQLGAVGSEERFGTLGGGARDQVAIGVRFGLREVAGRAGVTREDGGFGAECGDPRVPQQRVP